MNNIELNVIDLNKSEMINIEGGNPIVWMVVGYIFGEVMQGVYQASQNCPPK